MENTLWSYAVHFDQTVFENGEFDQLRMFQFVALLNCILLYFELFIIFSLPSSLWIYLVSYSRSAAVAMTVRQSVSSLLRSTLTYLNYWTCLPWDVVQSCWLCWSSIMQLFLRVLCETSVQLNAIQLYTHGPQRMCFNDMWKVFSVKCLIIALTLHFKIYYNNLIFPSRTISR